MKSQVNAVVETILSVLEENGIEYELNSEVNVKDVLNPDMLIDVRQQLLTGFNNNEISMTDKARVKNNTEKLMKSYVSGLVNNWVRKYKPFNNGVKYEIKNPGSRQGSGDEQVKEMRKLLKTIPTDQTATRAQIQTAIDARIAVIKPESVVEINTDLIPEHLRNLIS